ncbi:MAG: TerB family tellurite resistance protein [Pseudomonadota bacterium]
MFGHFLQKLTASDPAPLAPPDARLALMALLVRLARSDGHYDSFEVARITSIAEERYHLDAEGAEALRREAEALEAEAPDTVRFTRAIKDAVPYDDRVEVIEALWQVALADGSREAEEDALIRLAANLLGVKDVDSAMARQRVSRQG